VASVDPVTALPTLFLSHGAPDTILRDTPARRFLSGLAGLLPRPRAIVVVSAHWESDPLAVDSGARPRTIHDFSGFGPELEAMTYPAPGDPALAAAVVAHLDAAGLPAIAAQRGFDHGVWVPLRLAWPAADIPVVAVSLPRRDSGAVAYRLGQALAGIGDDVLVIGSGSATHNLGRLAIVGAPPAWAAAFDDWLCGRAEAGDHAALVAWRDRAPQARTAHPSDEHFTPLLVAAGAAGAAARATVLHRSWDYGSLAMTALAFARPLSAGDR
jgi:4,5-DOPA dioxygenase extradiol